MRTERFAEKRTARKSKAGKEDKPAEKRMTRGARGGRRKAGDDEDRIKGTPGVVCVCVRVWVVGLCGVCGLPSLLCSVCRLPSAGVLTRV